MHSDLSDGRIEQRRIARSGDVANCPSSVQSAGARFVVRITRDAQFKKTGKRRKTERVYHVTNQSPEQASCERLLALNRGYWGANGLNYDRDVSPREDDSRVRMGSMPRVMATVANQAISILRLVGTQNITRRTNHLHLAPVECSRCCAQPPESHREPRSRESQGSAGTPQHRIVPVESHKRRTANPTPVPRFSARTELSEQDTAGDPRRLHSACGSRVSSDRPKPESSPHQRAPLNRTLDSSDPIRRRLAPMCATCRARCGNSARYRRASIRIDSRKSGREPAPLSGPWGAGRRLHLRTVDRHAGRPPLASSPPSVARESSPSISERSVTLAA